MLDAKIEFSKDGHTRLKKSRLKQPSTIPQSTSVSSKINILCHFTTNCPQKNRGYPSSQRHRPSKTAIFGDSPTIFGTVAGKEGDPEQPPPGGTGCADGATSRSWGGKGGPPRTAEPHRGCAGTLGGAVPKHLWGVLGACGAYWG